MAKDEMYHDKKPGPLTVKVLVENSLGDTYEDARLEWDLDSYQPEGGQNTCDLCNNPHLKKNWVIRNVNTGKTLVVGSTCIKRFIILKGTADEADTARRLDMKEKEYEREMDVRILYKSVVQGKHPFVNELRRFRKNLMQILEDRGLLHLRNDREGIIKLIQTVFMIDEPSEDEIERLYNIFNRFNHVVNISIHDKETAKLMKQETFEEGSTWQRKSRNRVTGTSLSSSEAYRPDKD